MQNLTVSFSTLFNSNLYHCMAFVIALFVLLAPPSISTGYYCIIIVSDCTYTLKINKMMHCHPNQSKPWQMCNVYLPRWLPVQTIFKTVYINIQAALNSSAALQDKDVTTVTFLVKGKGICTFGLFPPMTHLIEVTPAVCWW